MNGLRVYLDTTVLVAASIQSHPHHAQALSVVQRVVEGHDTGYISTHSLAETYSTLTRLQLTPPIHPSDAERILTDNILPHFQTVPLTCEDYMQAITVMRESGFAGPKIYDALILTGADKCQAEQIYSFNMRDFVQLATPEQREKLSVPPLVSQLSKWDALSQEKGVIEPEPLPPEKERER